MATIIDHILKAVRAEVDADQRQISSDEMRRRATDAPPVRSLVDALQAPGFGLIAEIKRRAPSRGPMREENVREAPAAYRDCAAVRAVSVLTNRSHFDMSPDDLTKIRSVVGKPVLRKDFIIDPYQIDQARVIGADAILLMANVLDAERLRDFYAHALELGMEALFEVHSAEQLDTLPAGARVVGINSRTFDSASWLGLDWYTLSKWARRLGLDRQDLSIRTSQFELVSRVRDGSVKIAESGVTAETVSKLPGMGFDAALVGNSLLLDPAGIRKALTSFEASIGEDRTC